MRASMWPRLVGRGNVVITSICLIVLSTLQCGRGWLAAETPSSIRFVRLDYYASMWPRLVGRGNRLALGDQLALDVASMWPRLVGRGNGPPGRHSDPARRASMWPRLVGRGNLAALGQPFLAWPPASMWPRLVGRGNAARGTAGGATLSGRFNVAAAGWPRKPSQAGSRCRSLARFNVAAAGWPRKHSFDGGTVIRGLGASMWPRLVGRGNSGSTIDMTACRSGFNVAAAGWPRKLELQYSRDRADAGASMWPRLVGRGNDINARLMSSPRLLQCGRGWLAAETPAAVAEAEADFRASMWPRLVGRGNSRQAAGFMSEMQQLQCGRGWLAAETSRRPSGRRQEGEGASMWPRLVGRGNHDERHDQQRDDQNASMWPRLVGRGNVEQRACGAVGRPASMWPRLVGRGNGGDPVVRWRHAIASMWPRLVGRGNLRVAASLIKKGQLQCGRGWLAAETGPVPLPSEAANSAASMWPRLVGRGNPLVLHPLERLNDRFNVAAAGWPRKPSAARSLSSRRSCFNVAAAGWPRKPTSGVRSRATTTALQCGRGWLAAETSSGRSVVVHDRPCRFNVAAAGWPRKRPPVRREPRRPDASMWPRLVGRGNQPDMFMLAPGLYTLQCGRGWLAAETMMSTYTEEELRSASMWPRLVGRGNVGVAVGHDRGAVASMWPRLVGRGNPAPSSAPAARPAGFNVAAAGWPRKRRLARNGLLPSDALQCGRGWLAAETGGPAADAADRTPASMWPRLVGRGNRQGRPRRSREGRASMWPRLVGRGNAACGAGEEGGKPGLQCGRGWLAAETQERFISLFRSQSFNVAAAGWPRKLRHHGLVELLSTVASMWPRLVGRGNRPSP